MDIAASSRATFVEPRGTVRPVGCETRNSKLVTIPMEGHAFAQHIVFGPGHHKSDLWDLVYLKLDYNGQIIELGDADNTKFRNANTGQWVKENVDFSASEIREIFSISVPVMPKDKLLSYKSKLQREVDKIDLEQIK